MQVPGITKNDKPGLDMLFHDPHKEARSIKFMSRPLGLDFVSAIPIVVGKVHHGSPAEELGVKEGWVLSEVHGEKIDGKSIEQLQQLLIKIAKTLPKVSKP